MSTLLLPWSWEVTSVGPGIFKSFPVLLLSAGPSSFASVPGDGPAPSRLPADGAGVEGTEESRTVVDPSSHVFPTRGSGPWDYGSLRCPSRPVWSLAWVRRGDPLGKPGP